MRILLAVSGGIAAYKACELTSLAIKSGHELRVVMTRNATRFVAPVTFEALAGYPVLLDIFQGPEQGAVDHVAWAQWPQVVAVVPATANILGKLACGIADDVVSTVLMAVPDGIPVILAPAMNTNMWLHPVVQRNMSWLGAMGRYRTVEPVEKRLACGDSGPGALASPVDILSTIETAPLRVVAPLPPGATESAAPGTSS